MCTNFTIASGTTAIEKEFHAEFQYAFQKVYNAHFGMELPVIIGGDERKIVPFRWGLLPFWSREPNHHYHHVNACARQIVKNPVTRVPIRRRRCLVVANCFFIQAQFDGRSRVPMLVYDANQRLMSFAGIWDTWVNAEKTRMVHSFSIVTTFANQRLRKFCRSMPVIIPPGRRARYLRSSSHLNEIMGLLRPFDASGINLYPVSNLIRNPQNNSREVVLPVGQRVYKEYEYVPRVYLKLEGMGGRRNSPDRKAELKMMI
jgi:putative SOS response-associated peptidase YedK